MGMFIAGLLTGLFLGFVALVVFIYFFSFRWDP
jgi:hypothetical protein